ncbi:hypothetical protein BC940DRAFT_26414 [Gongronella butleri]|nr:hypothetical protein BC940DRAFT_26414 [Gongronella butleri]
MTMAAWETRFSGTTCVSTFSICQIKTPPSLGIPFLFQRAIDRKCARPCNKNLTDTQNPLFPFYFFSCPFLPLFFFFCSLLKGFSSCLFFHRQAACLIISRTHQVFTSTSLFSRSPPSFPTFFLLSIYIPLPFFPLRLTPPRPVPSPPFKSLCFSKPTLILPFFLTIPPIF